MEISKRLQQVASLVRYETVADIGTDHGYVPIYLYQQGRIKKAIACDINKGPLEKARENIHRYLAEDFIETRLGGGLSPLAVGEVDSIVIAGMGGMLMLSILQEHPQIVEGVKELILSPQSDLEAFRRYLHRVGLQIEREEMLLEEGKFYHFLRVVKGEERYLRKIDYLYGKYLLDEENPVLQSYLEGERKRTQGVLEHLRQMDSPSSLERRNELEQEQKWMEEALACLSV